ncbi:MAG TPA: hypothetical protein VI072_08975 [Polyangiaceae bacterium]
MVGARAELGKAGALRSGTGYPQVVIEVLRVDEQALGISALPAGSRTAPLARGTTIGVLGRARLLEAPGAAPARDSGDLRRVEHFEASTNRLHEAGIRQQAVRAAARRLGRSLIRRILGEPEPENEPL